MSAGTDGNDNGSNTDNQSEDHFSDATETGHLENKDDSDSGEDDETTTDSSEGESSLSDSAGNDDWENHFESVVNYHHGEGDADDDGSGPEEKGDFYKLACKQVEQVAKTTAIEKQKVKAQEGKVEGSLQNNQEEDVTVTVKLTATVELNEDDNPTGNSFEDSDACTVVSGSGPKNSALELEDKRNALPEPPPVFKVIGGPSSGSLKAKAPSAAKVNGDLDSSVDPHPLYTASLKFVYPPPKEDDGKKERPTKFAKNVPKDASETWDFSMQGILEDYQSNVLWVDGPFYQKFIGDCLHEMANTPCLSQCKNENGEVKKIALCRKCHVPFCSNQCFKKAKQKQSGEVDSDEASDTNPAEKTFQSQPIRNNLSLNSAQNARENNKPSYKDVCNNKRDAFPDKPNTSLENNKSGKSYQNYKSDRGDRDGNFGGGYNRQSRNQNQPYQNSYPYPQPGPNFPVGGPLTSPTQKFYPTQVLSHQAIKKSISPPQDSPHKILRNPKPGARSPHLSETETAYSGEDSKSFFSNNWKKKGQNPGNFPKPIQNKDEQFPPANPLSGFPNEPSSSNSSFPRNRNDSQFHPQQNEEDGNWRSKKKQPFSNNNVPGDNFSRHFNDHRGDLNYPPQGQGMLSKDSQQGNDFQGPYQDKGPQFGRGKPGGRGGKYQQDIHFRNINSSHDPDQRWVDMAKIGPSSMPPAAPTSVPLIAPSPESSMSSYHTASFHGQQPPSSTGSLYTARSTPMTSPSRTSSASYNIKVDVGKNHLHLNRDVPYGIPLPVKYVRGNSFQDFSVMTVRSHEHFGGFHRKLQTCPKQKMEICEVDNFCLAEYPSSDAENAPKQWYRGKITKIVGLVGIYFIDLGIEAVVNPEDVYELPQDHVKRWAQAIRLRCLNVKVDQNDPEAVEQFDALVRNATVKIRITHQDQTVKFRYACYLDVQYMGKWFDAGILLKKLFVGDRVPEEEIRQEEEKKSIIPLNRMKPPSDPILHEKQTEVIVRYIKSPNEFYITTIGLLEAYDLYRKLSNVQLPPQKNNLHAGDLSRLFFLIWDHIEKWQRVKVLEVGMNPDSVVVQKIDHGEIVTVPIKALKSIPDDLRFPSCVYKCSLPVKLYTNPHHKMKQCIEKAPISHQEMMQRFEQATNTLKKNVLGIIRVQVFSVEDAGTHIVDLFKVGNPDGFTSTLIQYELVDASHGFVFNRRPNANVAHD